MISSGGWPGSARRSEVRAPRPGPVQLTSSRCLLGLVADHHGLTAVLIVLAGIPLVASAGSFLLREPTPHP